jgi:insulysin
MFGNEGKGRLMYVMRKKGWCKSIVGGDRKGESGFGFLGINVEIKEEGIEKVDDVVKIVFKYVKMLKKVGKKEWIFKE